ncbi:Cytochrome Oxidase Assembly subunits [Caenorhabditis elegans]|nr:Cytochrome Oxidase Assembly subunits [Caenorhabditis elegans]CDH93010.2 Cytochrome Oxidase Assembly subunits [Caenorhabditis elegans]|eukprot:NP_001343699.1 Cytochrome Oxidase Assembly subunits [Caenorhabditis elegans]
MGSTGLYLAQKSVQWKVRALPHYNESLKIVMEHPKALEAIGAPISIGSVELSDRLHNYVDKTTSRLRIPVTGVVDCGFMDVLAVRENDKTAFETAKVRLFLNDGVYTIYDTGRWSETETTEE